MERDRRKGSRQLQTQADKELKHDPQKKDIGKRNGTVLEKIVLREPIT